MTGKGYSILDYFKAGLDERAFGMLVDKYGPRIYNVALNMVRDEQEAEDVTQEVFIKIYRGISQFRGEARLSTWIYRIAKNACYSHLKKEKKYRDMTEIEDFVHLASNGTNPEEAHIVRDEKLQVRRAVYELPEKHRLAISLYYFHEKSYEEISKIMDVPMGTIKSYIHRAKQSLAKSLDKIREG